MATLQMTRTPLQQKTWEAVFPNEQLTEQKSTLFVKKLLAVAISSVTYLRAIFPEHAFGDKCLEDLNLKVLRDESSCPGACQVIKWVKGCFDALDKKYLKTLVLGIFTDPNEPETLIESFTFKFSYKNHGEIDIYRNDQKLSSAHSADETKKATIMLLRTLVILTNTLKPLPENVMMTMKLFYFDDVTPTDYEPPGFKPSDDNNFQFIEDVANIAVGEVSTPFHTFKMRVKTGSDQFVTDSSLLKDATDEVANDDHMKSNMTLKDAETLDKNSTINDAPCEEIVMYDENEEKNNSKAAAEDLTSKDSKEDKMEDEFAVRCPCGCNEDDGLMIMCSTCNTWQHGICFLITDENKAPTVHICEQCPQLGTKDVESTDPYLTEMSPIAVQATCLWRRTLMACLEFKRLLAPHLARRLGVETTVAQGLINRLEKEEFVTRANNKGKKLGKIVDKEKIRKDGIPTYLKTPKTFKKKSSKLISLQECHMEEEIVNAVRSDSGISSEKSTVIEINEKKNVKTTVDSLVDETNKINLTGKKRKGVTQNLPGLIKPQNSDVMLLPSRRGKKRTNSLLDNSEFELSASQEDTTRSKRKKASTVKKHLMI